MSTWLALGSANIALGIVFRKKWASENDNEEVDLFIIQKKDYHY